MRDMELMRADSWMRWNMKTQRATMGTGQIQVKKQGKYYFCYCPIFDFWAVGRTQEEAWRRLKEDLYLLLTRCSRYEARDRIIPDYSFATAEIRA